MPQLDANRSVQRKAVVRIKRKKKTAVYKVKAPVKQPGPISDAEQKKVNKVNRTERRQRISRATEKGYESQGKQIQHAANAQRKIRLKKQTGVTTYHPLNGKAHPATLAELEKLDRYNRASPKEQARLNAAGVKAIQRQRATNKAETVKKLAPVLRVLDQTTRPLHAIAASERQVIKDKGQIHPGKVAKAFSRGIQNKDKSTASDVLKDLGVKNKTIRAVGGFAGDVAGDPLTYATGGVGSVAKRAAEKEASRVAKKAVAKGLTKEQADRMGQRAAKRALVKKPDAKGATVKLAGHEVPGVRRATAAASRPVRKVARKIVPQRTRSSVRNVAGDVNPNIAPVGVAKAEHDAATRVIRTARAKTNRGLDEAQKKALAIKKHVGEDNYSKVIDALESGNLKTLSPELRRVAVQIRSEFRHANRLRRQAGIRGGERKNYVPHQLTKEAIEAEGKKAGGGVGSKVIRPSSSKARIEKRSLKQLRQDKPGRYSENLPELFGNRVAEGRASVAKAEMNRRLADMGTTVKKGADLPDGSGTHAVFQIKGSDIRQITDKADLQKLVDEGGKSGRYVILNKDIVKRATEGQAPSPNAAKGVGKAADRTTAAFKRIATATPGFHVRNLLGDTQNAYLGQGGHRLPGNLVRSARVLKAAGRHDKALRKLDPTGKAGKATLKTKRYGNVSYDDVAKHLAEHGAYRSGYTAKEIPELAGAGAKGVKVSKVRVPKSVKTAALNREDLPRLSTAVDALRKGATWEEAASKVADYHFDYQHLTSFERNVARRVMPFYTFSARNIPLQAKTLLTKPGKYATYQKAREEGSKATGVQQDDRKTRDLYAELRRSGVKLPKGWQSRLSEWEQRNAGVPISWKGHKFTVSFGLPLQDLNELPGAAGSKQLDEYFQKFMSMTNPIAKDPVEYFNNFSFFFRDQIERPNSPLVAAPSPVGNLPAALKKKLGVTQIIDKKTGKKVWAWPAKTDYLAKAVPGIPQYAQQFMSGTDRRGKGTAGKVLSFSGIKSVPFDPVTNAVSLTYDRQQDIEKQLGALHQQGVDAKHPNAEYNRLKAQSKKLESIRAAANLDNPQKAHLLIKANDALLKVTARKAKVKKTNDNFYYSKEYQALLDREKALRQQIKDVSGVEAPKATIRLSRRPLTLREQLEKERDKLKSGGLREELERELERSRARTAIQSGG